MNSLYNTIEGKDRMIEGKDKTIAVQDVAVAAAQESSDRATALIRIKETYQDRKWGEHAFHSFFLCSDAFQGSVTRANAWKMLKEDGRVDVQEFLPDVKHARKDILASEFSKLKPESWKAERDMYPDIIKAMKEGLYGEKEDILVVDTHQNNDFHADIGVAEYGDSRLVYSLLYFLEFKHPTVGLRTPENCGQVLDYFNEVREKQPRRLHFVAILSNFSETWVYVASFSKDGPKIIEYPCRSLADAVVYAEGISKSQFKMKIPRLDSRFEPNYKVLAVGKHYFLLSVTNSPSPVPARTTSRNQGTTPWKTPRRHCDPKGRFVMKVAHDDGCSLENEIKFLTKIRNAQCRHLPELVWAPTESTELGIMPLGVPIRPPESQLVSRKIIQGMIEGLKYLHGQHIIHRDIRLSNLILQRSRNDINVVIIDYETAYGGQSDEVEYLGGYICWPRRLLVTGTKLYIPEAADDLYASILVVLHMLFPRRFDDFGAGEIGLGDMTPETVNILQVWKDIEASTIWGRFYTAATHLDYDTLLEMSDFFCHV